MLRLGFPLALFIVGVQFEQHTLKPAWLLGFSLTCPA